MLLLTASVALLVIVCGMFLLAKVQKENLHKFYKLGAYLIIISGLVIFTCSFTRSALKMCKSMRCMSSAKCEKTGFPASCGKVGKHCCADFMMHGCGRKMKGNDEEQSSDTLSTQDNEIGSPEPDIQEK